MRTTARADVMARATLGRQCITVSVIYKHATLTVYAYDHDDDMLVVWGTYRMHGFMTASSQ